MFRNISEALSSGMKIEDIVQFYLVDRFYDVDKSGFNNPRTNWEEIDLLSQTIGIDVRQCGSVITIIYQKPYIRMESVSPGRGYEGGSLHTANKENVRLVARQVGYHTHCALPLIVAYCGKSFKTLVRESKKALLKKHRDLMAWKKKYNIK